MIERQSVRPNDCGYGNDRVYDLDLESDQKRTRTRRRMKPRQTEMRARIKIMRRAVWAKRQPKMTKQMKRERRSGLQQRPL